MSSQNQTTGNNERRTVNEGGKNGSGCIIMNRKTTPFWTNIEIPNLRQADVRIHIKSP